MKQKVSLIVLFVLPSFIILSLTGIHAQSTSTICTIQFRQNMTSVTVGATAKPQFADKASCEAGCSADPLCNSYQVATTGVICWFQYTAINFNNVWAAPGVTEYIKIQNCTSIVPACQYVANATNAGVGATGRPDLLTQAACEASCTADPLCLTYQINTAVGSTLCWLQYTAGSANRPVTGITEYVKVCSTVVTTLPPVVTPKSPTIVCTAYYFVVNASNNYVTTGANFYNNYLSRSGCESACLRSSRYCYSYQYQMNGGCCYLQLNSYGAFVYKYGFVEYVRKCYQVACTISFINNSTMVSTGAVAYPQYATKSSCEYACSTDASCLSYQIDTSINRISYCWLNYRNVDPNRLISLPGVTEYFRQCA